MRRRKDQFVLLSLVIGSFGVYKVVTSFRKCSPSSPSKTLSSGGLHLPSLAASELPGYTGWARPSNTLTSRFRIKERDDIALVQRNWTVTVTCDGCSNGDQPIWFYSRAYGPGILNGIVERQSGRSDEYKVYFHPMLEGDYTVEVVLTYSRPIDPERFPLTEQQVPPPYEGYMLPMFPLQLTVTRKESSARPTHTKDKLYCSIDQLTLTTRSSVENPMWNRAGWTVNGTNTGTFASSEHSTSSEVSMEGYALGINSLGFTATYDFAECRLVDQFVPEAMARSFPAICPNPWKAKVHVILIGDSVMRLQKTWIEKQVLSSKDVKVTYLELYGGALRCSRLSGPNITEFLNDPILKSGALTGPRVVVFNTGMHDIHRLCGSQFNDDRLLYLTEAELSMSCTTLYRKAIQELASVVVQIPADAYIFQTTTAAWPKYGNFGVAWDPRYAQELPLDAAFVARFNEIAISEVQSLTRSHNKAPRVHIVDAYWITLARPDNREISAKAEIGKKLSHPGLESISGMVRMWWQVVVQQICTKK